MDENNIQEERLEQTFAGKSLAELSEIFKGLLDSSDKMERSKEAEAIKSAFYKLLGRLRSEAEQKADEIEDAFAGVEENFKSIYADYKRERAEFNRRMEEEREANLLKKQAVIDELKALVEGGDAVNFPAFRELQDRWRNAGQVPVTRYRDINDTYQFYVEKFYDKVEINRDLRDLDFRKNLEAKQKFCEIAEKLSENDNVVDAFNELQKLHEQWKEFGPVAKEFRDDIWNRFKAATTVVNKRYQEFFEEKKEKMAQNLAAKTVLCEKIEEIVSKEPKSSGDWNAASKEIEGLQAEWRKIGFASKKDNQKIYDRFRAACDGFYSRKREFYNEFRNSMDDNVSKKMSIIERAEALKESKEWKKATEEFIELQKQWKESGALPRKKGEELWKRFRAACDAFFAERDANAAPSNNYHYNLKLKKKLIEEIEAYVLKGDAAADKAAMEGFSARWTEIGFVPFKDKESVQKAYNDAMKSKFGHGLKAERNERNEKNDLVRRYRALQQDIANYENNIGFFSASKNADALIAQMKQRIEEAKKELKELEEKVNNG